MITSRALFEFQPPQLYCCIAAAVLGAGALSAGAGIWGANKAADAQTSAANASIANQQNMFGKLQGVVQPFIDAGQGGISKLQDWLNPSNGGNPLSSLISTLTPGNNTLGADNSMLATLKSLVTPGPDQSATLAGTPGYQFSVDQGTRAALNSLAARGLGGSPGAIAKGVGGYVAGTASQNYNNVVQNLINSITSGTGLQNSQVGGWQNLFSSGAGALQGLINTGTSAAGTLAGVGTNTANSVTGSLQGAGNAQAAAANATGSNIGNLGSSVTTAALLQKLMGSNNGSGSIYGGNTGFTGTDAAMNQSIFPGYGTG